MGRVGRKGPTQEQLFWQEHRKIADGNILFNEMVRDGSMTKASLGRLIERRPNVWGRFSGFLKTLPN